MTRASKASSSPELKEYFHLGYQQQMYVVTAKSIPFVFCPLLALFIQRAGYVRSLGIAMSMYASGTAVLIPGWLSRTTGLSWSGFGIHRIRFHATDDCRQSHDQRAGTGSGLLKSAEPGQRAWRDRADIAPALMSVILPASAIAVQSKMPRILGLLLVLGALLAIISATTFGMRSSFTDFTDVTLGG